MNQYFAGIDVSTQSMKIVVLSLHESEVVYAHSVNYDKDLPQYKTENGVRSNAQVGVSESDPKMWIDAIHLIFTHLRSTTDIIQFIKSISIAGQQHGLVSIDAQGELTKPDSKLWNDFSTQEECNILTEKIGSLDKMINEIGNSQRSGYTASKIFHMYRNERSYYDSTKHFLLVHNYINWYLTGGKIAMEEGDASGTGIWDPITKKWSKKIINAISKDLINKLPQVTSSTKSIGNISNSLAHQYGFDSECKIDAGSGDNMYSAIGTGNIDEGLVTISLGTSGTAFTVLEDPYIDPSGEIACFCDSTGKYLPLLCISNMAGGYNDFLEQNSISHTDFELLVLETDPGNLGNIIVPWYEGERTPDLPNACPIYFGFNFDDLNQKSIARGLIEGHVLNLYDGFSKLSLKPRTIHLTGGLSRSSIWCQMISDVFNCETVRVKGEGVALGAAIHAAWVWKNESGIKTQLSELVKTFVHYDEDSRCKPSQNNVNIYRDLFSLYQSITKRIRGMSSSDPFQLKKELFQK